MNARFSKITDNSWGITVTGGTVSPGDKVTVSKRDGTTTEVVVKAIVYRDPQGRYVTCAIEPSKPTGGSSAPARGKGPQRYRSHRRPCGYCGSSTCNAAFDGGLCEQD